MGKVRNPIGNPNMAQISKEKSTGPKTDLGRIKIGIGKIKKGRVRDKSILNDAMIDAGFNTNDRRSNMIKVLFSSWMSTKTMKEAKEILKIETTLKMVEQSMLKHLLKKMKKEVQFDTEDMAKLKLIIDSNEKLYKMKHGETKTIKTIDFKDVLDMYNKKVENAK